MGLRNKRIAFLVANEGVERVELLEPWHAVQGNDGIPTLIAPEAGRVQTMDHLDKSATFEVDVTTTEAASDRFDALVLPGGVANPDRLRRDGPAVNLVRRFFEEGKPVAAICHAPWILIEAGVVQGRRMTSAPSLRIDLRNAGADWVDETVVVDPSCPTTLVTSRGPGDLPAFCQEILERLGAPERVG